MSRRSLRAGHKRVIEEPLVNLTPLIDVVFVILIMFIVVAPLLELDRIELADAGGNPLDGTIAASENSPIRIHVHRDNSITFNNQPVSIEQLIEKLKQAKVQFPNVRPQLFQDKKGHFGVYQSVKNATEEAGFQQLDIILNPS